MVRAILAGNKSMTRRILKPQSMFDGREEIIRRYPNQQGMGWEVGDRLWVREGLRARNMDLGGMLGLTKPLTKVDPTRDDLAVAYAADGEPAVNEHEFDYAWIWKRLSLPSIHMPRSMSRITLLVTAVRVERLHDITEADARAEGIERRDDGSFWILGIEHPNKDFPYLSRPTAREMFAALWDVIHSSGAWLTNPLVVAISFSVERTPT